jgi:hypothetical protein
VSEALDAIKARDEDLGEDLDANPDSYAHAATDRRALLAETARLRAELAEARAERDALLKGRRDWQERVERDAYLAEQERADSALGALAALQEAVAAGVRDCSRCSWCVPTPDGPEGLNLSAEEAGMYAALVGSSSLSTAYRAKVRREALEGLVVLRTCGECGWRGRATSCNSAHLYCQHPSGLPRRIDPDAPPPTDCPLRALAAKGGE